MGAFIFLIKVWVFMIVKVKSFMSLQATFNGTT